MHTFVALVHGRPPPAWATGVSLQLPAAPPKRRKPRVERAKERASVERQDSQQPPSVAGEAALIDAKTSVGMRERELDGSVGTPVPNLSSGECEDAYGDGATAALSLLAPQRRIAPQRSPRCGSVAVRGGASSPPRSATRCDTQVSLWWATASVRASVSHSHALAPRSKTGCRSVATNLKRSSRRLSSL